MGVEALRYLADEVRRIKAQRTVVVCGQTVAHRTDLLARIKAQPGTLYAGVFEAMDKDSSWPAVQKGVEAACAAGGGPRLQGLPWRFNRAIGGKIAYNARKHCAPTSCRHPEVEDKPTS